MKVYITSSGTTLDSPVDPRFGRAPRFLAVDADTGAFEAIDNEQVLNAPQGAGIQAAETVANGGADALLTGHCGPKAFRALRAAGVAVYLGLHGLTAAEALERLRKGEIQPSDGADVEGHWV